MKYVLISCLVLGGCGNTPQPWRTTADPIDYPDIVPALRLVEEQRYDHDFVTDAFHLRVVGVDAHRAVYVIDQLAAAVIAFAPSGSSRSIGREGDGPGELRTPLAGAVSDDTLYVMSQTRISTFLLDGTPIRSEALITGSRLWIPFAMAAVDDGLLIYGRRSNGHGLLHYNGEAIDTVLMMPGLELHQEKGQSWYYSLIGLAQPSVSLSPAGLAYVSTGSPYEISVWDASGQVAVHGTNPPPVSTDAVDQQAYEWLIGLVDTESAGPHRQAVRWRDFVEGTVADADGNVLVNRRDLLGDGTRTWDYLTPDWRAVGRVVVPWRLLDIELLDGCHAYGIETDENAIATVVRYRFDPCPVAEPA